MGWGYWIDEFGGRSTHIGRTGTGEVITGDLQQGAKNKDL